ncbi:MAG TPA: erythromycin esterase family protein [Blastocatellia bacterium]|nr:erythromycin esterase family protein [Blastocatellia bacterium]
MKSVDVILSDMLQGAALPLNGADEDYDKLMELVGDAKFVLIGEASHGTHEFYRERARITKRLIREKGFTAVAVEADWPDAYRIGQYVRGEGKDGDAVEALAGFKRFPAWMWRNAEVLDFVGWLRAHNDNLSPSATKAGFYGLDLYSLHASIDAVLTYLDAVDPIAAANARRRYACFDHYGPSPEEYGRSTRLGVRGACEQEVISQLVDLRRRAFEYARRDGRVAADSFFNAEQNARLIRNAEAYYRAMFLSSVGSWNLRDRHMAETLDSLFVYLRGADRGSKIVVWAHNSHLGDARATEMGSMGELNLGQLVRERHGNDCFLIGFTTFSGTVTAASNWGGPAERKAVRPALRGSYEDLFHEVGRRFLIPLCAPGPARSGLHNPQLERAIGVIYRPETERQSHYFHAMLSEQFDAVIHFDSTRAVEPLERTAEWEAGELPETYPSGV